LRAKELGWGAASLTEHGTLGSAPTFYKACRENGISPIIGCEFYVVPDEILGVRNKETRTLSYHLTVLALSAEGYHNLVAWITFAHQRENYHYKPRISLEAMANIAPHPLHHNVVLSGCLASELCNMLAEANGNGVNVGTSYVEAIKSIFPNFYLEIQNHKADKFMGRDFTAYEELIATEAVMRDQLLKLAKVTGTGIVLTNDSHFQKPDQRKSHLAMKASSWAHRDEAHFTESKERLIQKFMPDYVYFTSYLQDMEKRADIEGGREGIQNAIEIAKEADIRLEPLDAFSYSIPFSGYDDPITAIRRRCKARLAELVGLHGKAARERFEAELEAMGEFAHYLLLMSDFLIAAHKQGILTNTRGSAANSILCYCLRIHDIDSIEEGLTFSRFFNPARKKLPDIDIDLERDRYEDFMQNIVIPKMDELEGEGQVIPICNYGTLANRSAFRLIAESLGIDKDKQDEISKLLPQLIDSGMVDEENDVYEVLKADFPEIYELASGVFDNIRNISVHACGWLFGTKDRPIQEWVPTALIASSNTTVTQFNLKSLGDMGLVKGDFLRLKTLSVIQRTRKALGQNTLSITDIPLDDPATFETIREGRTEGVFTLQGKENRRGVMEIQAQTYRDVIIAVALYRPALTRGKLHEKFNRRRKGLEEVSYPHPIAEEILGWTHGIPVFQEQVMDIGYAVGMDDKGVDEIYEAIKLAKGIGRGAKQAFEKIRPKFFDAARSSDISESEAEGLWELVQGSQGYGFNKGHAASYGVLAVRAAYLKTHHPLEFFTALLDVYPEKAKYIAAARAEGMEFLPPSISTSGAGFTLDRGTGSIRVGLSRIRGLGPVAVRAIVDGQPYSSIDDFRERVPRSKVDASQLDALVSLGAFSDMGIPRSGTQLDEFKLLNFTLKKPEALKGKKPKHVGARTSERNWVHEGLTRDVEMNAPRHSVSKLFWIPDWTPYKRGEKKIDPIFELKSSPFGQVKTYLLTALDENGLPFQIMVNEDKDEANVIKYLSAKCRGMVVCLDGVIRGPFLTDGPLGFRCFGISGARFQNDPQIWTDDKKIKRHLVALSRR
jgi:DNA polymerase-3 subunit alpha